MGRTDIKFEKQLSKRVYQLCLLSNLSPKELSIKAGMYPDAVHKIVKYDVRPIRRTLYRLCKAAGITLEEFLEIDKYE